MKKRLLWGLLLALAVSVLLALPAFALTEGDWEFQLLDGEAQITDYLGEGGDVVIPSTLHGATVTSIDRLDLLEGATSITVPGTIKKVGMAYYGLKDLTALTLQEGVEEYSAGILQEMPNLTEVRLPSTLKKLGSWSFARTGITRIDLPAGLKTIGDNAFSESALESVDLSNLTGLELCIGIFEDCKSLSSMKLPADIVTIPQSFLSGCPLIQEIDFPATVTEIGSHAFNGCDLRSIILPTGLKKINAAAFIKNRNLQEVVIPYGVTSLAAGMGKYHYGVFNGCTSLKAVYIPDTVTGLAENLIQDCPDCIVYCTQDSAAAKHCQKYKISYLTDKSVNSPVTVLYNGTRISFDAYAQDPVIVSGRTLVPLRSIFEAMGADVQWDDATRTATATRGSTTIRVQIGAAAIEKNGQSIASDVPAQIINGRTMVPVRVISEAFSCQVDWNAAGKTVLIRE